MSTDQKSKSPNVKRLITPLVNQLTEMGNNHPEKLQNVLLPSVGKLKENLKTNEVNLFVFGPTSVGKSETINAVTGVDICPTGTLETTQGQTTIYLCENMNGFDAVTGEQEQGFDTAEEVKTWCERSNTHETNMEIYGSFPSSLISCASITDSQGVLHDKHEPSTRILKTGLNGSTPILVVNSNDLHAIEHSSVIEEISNVYTMAKTHNPNAKLIVFMNKCDQLNVDPKATIAILTKKIKDCLCQHEIESIVVPGSARLMKAIQLLNNGIDPIQDEYISRKCLLPLYNHYFDASFTKPTEVTLPPNQDGLLSLLTKLSGIHLVNEAIESTTNGSTEAVDQFISEMMPIIHQELLVHGKNKEEIPKELQELINISTELGQASLDPSFCMMNALTTRNTIEAKPGQFIHCNDGSKVIVIANEKSISHRFPVLTVCTTVSPIEHRKLYMDDDQTYMAPFDSVTLLESLKRLESTPSNNAEWITKVETVVELLKPLAKYIDAHTTHQTNIHPENVITTVDGEIAILNSTQSTNANRYPNDGVQMFKVLMSGTLFGYGSDSEGLLGYVQHTPQVSKAFVQWFKALKTGSSTCVESLDNLKNIGQNGHYEKYICTVGGCANEVQSPKSKCSTCTSSSGWSPIWPPFPIGGGSSSSKPTRYGGARTNTGEYWKRREDSPSKANQWARETFGITFSGPRDVDKLRNKHRN